MLNLANQSYADWLIQQRSDYYADLVTFRQYANGEQYSYMTDDQRTLLVGNTTTGTPNRAPEVVINVCAPVLDAETDRLQVRGFQVTVEDNEELSDQLSTLVSKWWKKSRMDEGHQNVNYTACRDGNSFIMVWYDQGDDDPMTLAPSKGHPRMTFNRAYDGSVSGADMFYQDDDPAEPLFAVKIWTVQRPGFDMSTEGKITRKNVYYENRIEKYIRREVTGGQFADAQWRPLKMGDPDFTPDLQQVTLTDEYERQYQATVAWWTDTGEQTGRPLGIPVFHFRHQARGEAYGRSSIADIAPGVQDAVNMTALALLAATQLSGFKITTATGFKAGDSVLAVWPGGILVNEDPAGAFGQLQESNLLQIIEVLNSYIKNAASLTGTPLNFFTQTGQIPAEGTQKQLEAALLAKVRRDQTAFGNAYEDAVRMMLKLEALYGTDVTLSMEEIDDLFISCEWEPAEMRNEVDVVNMAVMKHEKLSVPLSFALAEVGYTQDEIDAIEQERDLKRNMVIGQLTQQLRDQEATNQFQQQLQNQNVAGALPPNGNGAQTTTSGELVNVQEAT